MRSDLLVRRLCTGNSQLDVTQHVSLHNVCISSISFVICFPALQNPVNSLPCTPGPNVAATIRPIRRIHNANLSRRNRQFSQDPSQTNKRIFLYSYTTPFASQNNSFHPHAVNRCTAQKLHSSTTARLRRRPRSHHTRQGIVASNEPVVTSKDEQLRLDARSCFKNGDLKGASKLLKHCIRIRPENGRAWQDFAKVEGLRRESIRATAAILRKALQHNPRNPYLWQSLGFLMCRLRKYDTASGCFQNGIGADPSHSSLYTTYAKMEFERGRVAEARELFEKGLVAGIVDARLYHCWGLMEMKLGNAGRSRQLLQKGLAIDEQNPFIWQSLALVAHKEGNTSDARVCYENALKTGKSGVAVLDALAKLEAQEGNDQIARDLFAKGVQAHPDDVRILHSWSVFEYQRGKFQKARDLIKKALQMNSSDSFLWSHYAIIAEALINYPLARALFKRACTVRPQDWRAWDRWSAMEHKVGNVRESEILLKESFRIRFKAKGAFTILANNIRDKYY